MALRDVFGEIFVIVIAKVLTMRAVGVAAGSSS
jgi:hypothetical protein